MTRSAQRALPFGETDRGATLRPCGRYRYTLWRRWGTGTRCVFVMLNPSTADAVNDDPTIRRCMGFARAWGHALVEVVNLYAWRATDPRELRAAAARGEDVVGPDNDAHILAAITHAAMAVAAWGDHARDLHDDRWLDVRRLVCSQMPLHALRSTQSGHPGHPLYVPADTTPTIYTRRFEGAP